MATLDTDETLAKSGVLTDSSSQEETLSDQELDALLKEIDQDESQTESRFESQAESASFAQATEAKAPIEPAATNTQAKTQAETQEDFDIEQILASVEAPKKASLVSSAPPVQTDLFKEESITAGAAQKFLRDVSPEAEAAFSRAFLRALKENAPKAPAPVGSASTIEQPVQESVEKIQEETLEVTSPEKTFQKAEDTLEPTTRSEQRASSRMLLTRSATRSKNVKTQIALVSALAFVAFVYGSVYWLQNETQKTQYQEPKYQEPNLVPADLPEEAPIIPNALPGKEIYTDFKSPKGLSEQLSDLYERRHLALSPIAYELSSKLNAYTQNPDEQLHRDFTDALDRYLEKDRLYGAEIQKAIAQEQSTNNRHHIGKATPKENLSAIELLRQAQQQNSRKTWESDLGESSEQANSLSDITTELFKSNDELKQQAPLYDLDLQALTEKEEAPAIETAAPQTPTVEDEITALTQSLEEANETLATPPALTQEDFPVFNWAKWSEEEGTSQEALAETRATPLEKSDTKVSAEKKLSSDIEAISPSSEFSPVIINDEASKEGWFWLPTEPSQEDIESNTLDESALPDNDFDQNWFHGSLSNK